MKKGIQPVINGDGSFSRDFTYIDNVVQANIKALFTNNNKCYGEAFNIGAGGRFSLIELFNSLKKELHLDMEPKFGPNRIGDIPHSNADITKALNMLGYDPKIDFKTGIHYLINYNSYLIYDYSHHKLNRIIYKIYI